jgi:Rrf2 family transcriptional regulator, iron-sulfur cluster assembly transcription factor
MSSTQGSFVNIFINKLSRMFVSKSFGYAVRGILYIALMQEEERKVQVEEIADTLALPRHFLGKIMQSVVKAGFLHSTKGPYGGFTLAPQTLQVSLLDLLNITDGDEIFATCILGFRNCGKSKRCPLHNEMEEVKKNFIAKLSETTIADLLKKDKKEFIERLALY